MNELVFNENGASLTNSLLVAQKFGKRHKHVIDSIKDITTSAENSSNLFVESNYQDSYRRKQTMYIMNRDGFTLLAMGFTGKKAMSFKLEYINAFNKMESELKQIASSEFITPTTFADALRLAADQAERLELADKTIQIQAPKVKYHDDVLQSGGLLAINLIAKELGMSAVTLNKKLHDLGVIYKSAGTWVLYSKYQDKGYTKPKTTMYQDELGNDKSSVHTYWTQEGRKFIHELIKKQGL